MRIQVKIDQFFSQFYLWHGEFNLGINVYFFILRNDFRKMEKDTSVPFGTADETVSFLDSRHNTRFTFLAWYNKRFILQFDIGGTFQFIATINSNVKSNPISMSVA